MSDYKEIPTAYQGEDFKSPKELCIGQQVIDTHYGSPRLCTITKRYKMSVQVEFQGRTYGCPLHHLRRAA